MEDPVMQQMMGSRELDAGSLQHQVYGTFWKMQKNTETML